MKAGQRLASGLAALAVVALGTMTVRGQAGARAGEWPTYGGDLANTRYSPLDQINASNFNKLEVAWRYRPDNLGVRPETNLQVTPLVVKGRMYLTAGASRNAVALDALTGELLWQHRLEEGERAIASPRQQSGRGLAYWSDGRDERILYVSKGYQLVALNAANGQPISGFGKAGLVDLKTDFDQIMDPVTGEVALAAAPIVAKDVIVVGAAHLAGNAPKSKTHEKGYVRAFDVRPEVAEQVKSMGADFVFVDMEQEVSKDGYAKEMTAEQVAAAGDDVCAIALGERRNSFGDIRRLDKRGNHFKTLEMTVNFMGLHGPNGVLPRHYNDQLIQLQRNSVNQEANALRDWFDLFNNRKRSLTRQ